jgi:hypothetical protein
MQSASKSKSAASGSEKLTACVAQPAFDGTIASACGFIGLDNFIAMARVARGSDPRIASFVDAWDSLGPCEQEARGTADTLCKQAGFTALEMLRVVAAAACQYSMCVAQLFAAGALPSAVQRSIDVALTDEGIADRRMLFQHAGFLPTPAGSQTNIAITQANATVQRNVLALPRPEETIRRLSELRGRVNGRELGDGK